MNFTKALRHLYLLPALLVFAVSSHAQHNLPDFGETHAVSLPQERMLGRAWLMSFRRQVPLVTDPIIQDYLENLIYRLAAGSQLKERRLELVVVHNSTINAFAVPGGVIGVHDGLLLAADTEAQLASVLGHELAHLSQRHFARGMESRKQSSVMSMAGLLAGLVMVVAGAGEEGMGTIMGSQAAAQQRALRYSRQNEQEADRIGIQNVANVGIDPNGAGGMFENMKAASRAYGARPPEFLLTHPLTETRIADAKNRARQFPKRMYQETLDYQLVRTRIEKSYIKDTAKAVAHFRQKRAKGGKNAEAAQYGLILALTDQGEYTEARKLLAPLREFSPMNIIYSIAEIELDIAAGDFDTAMEQSRRGMELMPGNYPMTMTRVRAETKSGDTRRAEALLWEFSPRRPQDPYVWYELAELQGLNGQTFYLHQSRAKYFVLTGRLGQAEQQLRYALPMAVDYIAAQRIEVELRYVQKIRHALGNL